MNLLAAALPLVLGASAPTRISDLQVEAATAAGANLPELAEAVARALVASGARVVLRGPTTGSCQHCGKVTVTQIQAGTCRIEVRQERHQASATLRFPAGSPLFDRARAIAIQARLLARWDGSGEAKRGQAVRPQARKPEGKAATDAAGAPPDIAMAEPAPLPVPEDEAMPAIPSEPVARPLPEAPPAAEPETDSVAEAAPAKTAEPVATKPASRAEIEPARPARAEARLAQPASVVSAGAARPKSQWPWIPTAIGGAAGVAAGICAVVARNRYDALADKTRSYESAKALKSAGEKWQWASFALAGAAVAGIGTGLVGFVTRSSGPSRVAALPSPLPGGAMVAFSGGLP
ncbi:MAG: hypothetical protein JXP73_14335 [Deltaproteobacteria bacterium]|nr:hypothetical protein [Deltaproteobacteria bacterium]